MKKWIIFSALLCLLLLTGSVSAEQLSISGVIVDEKIYASQAPWYTENLIKSYGPVPSYDKDRNVASKGAMKDITGITERDILYKKLHNLYEATDDSITKQYSYPEGPVLSYGYDALGTVTVGIYENTTVDEKTMDAIYSIVATEAKKQGIDNVPVIFCREPIAHLDLGRSDTWRPIIGGVQEATNIGAATTGFAATRSGQSGFITAGHIGDVGDAVYQPDLSSPIGSLTVSSLGATSDSAWIQYSSTSNQIFESSGSQPWVYGTMTPYVGLGVTMSGISSGVTTGTVVRETSIYNSFFDKIIQNQWLADYSSTSGDSGAPVYIKDSNQHIQLLGVHWGGGAGYSFFSPVSNIIDDLS